MMSLTSRARRINDMRLAACENHEVVEAEFERINFALDQLNPRQMPAEEQRSNLNSLKEVFE